MVKADLKPVAPIGTVLCPFDPETETAQYMAWHGGFCEGARQANAIWNNTFPLGRAA